MAVRLIFFLLVLANLVFFVWNQGYFGESDEGHEPQRFQQQLNSEKLRIVNTAQPVARKEETACRMINGLTLADAETLKAAATAAGVEARVSPLAEPALHLVVITDLANKAAADKKMAELARLGVEGANAVALEGGRHEILLGRFAAEAAAREFLQGLTRKGIKSARVDARQQPSLKAGVEARGPATVLLQQLPKLIAPYAEATLGECAQ
jgi:hypothetical protein